MKKYFTIVTFLILSYSSKAVDQALFVVDDKKIDSVFSEINKAEAFLYEHPTYDVHTLENLNLFTNLTKDFNILDRNKIATGSDNTPMAILSFCSGFCCSAAGIALVFYISKKDVELTEYSIIGGLAAFAVIIAFVFVAPFGFAF